MNRVEWNNAFVGAIATVMTAAIIAVFGKVYDMGEKQAVLIDQVSALRLQVASLDVLVTDERINSAAMRAMCAKWVAKLKRDSGD